VTHELKIEKQWADAKLAGEKPFEIRLNDRGFQKGDRVQYRVVDPKTHEPYSRPLSETEFGSSTAHPLESCEFEITYVREGTENGLQPKYCVFADRPVRKRSARTDPLPSQTFVTVTSADGTLVDGTNFRPQDGDSDALLDAKIQFYTLNYLTIADDRMLARLSKHTYASSRKENT